MRAEQPSRTAPDAVVVAGLPPGIAERVCRLAEAAGVPVVRSDRPPHAGTVVAGAALLPRLAAAPGRRLAIVATSPPAAGTWRAALTAHAELLVVLGSPAADAELLAFLSAHGAAENRAVRLAVTAVRAGAGTSSLAARLAAAAGRAGEETVLVDAAGPGSGLSDLLAVSALDGARFEELSLAGGVDGRALIAALPEADRYRLLTWRDAAAPVGGADPVADSLGPLGAAADRLVLDLPPLAFSGLGTAALDPVLTGTGPRDRLLVLVPADPVALARARRILPDLGVPCEVVGRVLPTSRAPEIAQLDELGVPVAGLFHDDRRRRVPGGELSRRRGGADRLARRLLTGSAGPERAAVATEVRPLPAADRRPAPGRPASTVDERVARALPRPASRWPATAGREAA